LTEEEEA